MVKIKALSRNPLQYVRESPFEAPRRQVNTDPKLHQFSTAKELQRAVNATKYERMFSKPFLAALEGHMDRVVCLAQHPRKLSSLLSGDCNGEVREWNLARRETTTHIPRAHQSTFVNGVGYLPDGSAFLSCSSDKTVKLWKSSVNTSGKELQPLSTYTSESEFTCLSVHEKEQKFATAGHVLQLWDVERTSGPQQTFNWGNDHVVICKHNRAQPNLILCGMSDRSVCLYDARTNRGAQRMVMGRVSNAFVWNPMAPMEFALANDDWKVYVFDARNLRKALVVGTGHTHAVKCIDYAPSGRELVSGSLDKSIRIWSLDESHGQMNSRDIYHTKRMQGVHSVLWTLDNSYIITGSDEANVRLWKAVSYQPLKPLNSTEQRALDLAREMKDKFKDFPEVRKISRQKFVPREIKSKRKILKAMTDGQKRRLANTFANKSYAKGEEPSVPDVTTDGIVNPDAM